MYIFWLMDLVGFENEIWLDLKMRFGWILYCECMVMLYDGYMMVIVDGYGVQRLFGSDWLKCIWAVQVHSNLPRLATASDG